jgi:hypothetical protein
MRCRRTGAAKVQRHNAKYARGSSCDVGTNGRYSVFSGRSHNLAGGSNMHRLIVITFAFLGMLTFTSAPQANPLIPGGAIATAAAETGMVEQAHYRARHHSRGHHYGWYRGHHYGWRHRHHAHRY